MESELERFHKQNTNLELNIEELKLKLKATEKEMYHERQKVLKFSIVLCFTAYAGSMLLPPIESCSNYHTNVLFTQMIYSFFECLQ